VHPRETRLDKLQRQVVEASKQCGRNVLLQVGELVDWETYCAGAGLPGMRVLAHPGGEWQPGNGRWGQDVVAAVGPEGGFTDEEIAVARAAGWQVMGLGPRILRVETAALVLAVMFGGGGMAPDMEKRRNMKEEE
jgi:16S rRNA (uracil1498-N3)-methyltransferase